MVQDLRLPLLAPQEMEGMNPTQGLSDKITSTQSEFKLERVSVWLYRAQTSAAAIEVYNPENTHAVTLHFRGAKVAKVGLSSVYVLIFCLSNYVHLLSVCTCVCILVCVLVSMRICVCVSLRFCAHISER